jgi:hypothetical protein
MEKWFDRRVSAAAFFGGDMVFQGLGCGRVRLADTVSNLRLKVCQNKNYTGMN